jgi:pilus assembly protein CpaB
MRINTIVLLLIAIAFGVIAVFFANAWLTSQSRQAALDMPLTTIQTTTIVVAAVEFTFGEELQSEKLREIPWPKSAVPDGAFGKISELTADGRRVALTPMGPNEPILKWKISGPDARASLSAIVTAGMRAVSIRVNDVVGVGGFILPGDRVDVLYTRHGRSSGTAESSTDILIQNVRVLAVNQVADQKKSEPVVATVATIEVTTLDAQKIALAQNTGSLSLTLRSAGSIDQAAAQRVVEEELVSSPSVYLAALNERKAAQEAIDTRIAALENAVKQASEATGQDEEELRAKLAELEEAIRLASTSPSGGEAALRAKLAQFEAQLRTLASSSNRPVVIAAEPEYVADAMPTTVSIGVTRGVVRSAYEVPIDLTNR